MWAAIQGPFVVGLARWQWPKPGITVIVKSTYALGGAGRASLSPLQLGLATDHRGMGPSDEELEFASDFVPLKAHCDVLVVGHARSPHPVESLLVGIELDQQLSKRVAVMSREPARQVALESRAAFCEGGHRRMAPRPAPTHGWQLLDSMTDFDFGSCNVAPLDQQLSAIRPDARLVLTGLIGDGRPRDLRLAGVEPEAWYVPVGSSSPAPRPVALRCDTLWIHGDRKICTLTWRGTVELDPAALTTAHLAVQAAGADAAAPADGEDAEWKAVVEAHQLAPGPPAELPLSEAAQRSAEQHPPPKGPRHGGTRVLSAPSRPGSPPDEPDREDAAHTLADDAGLDGEPPESEEPAPITARAGVMLGGLGGASLGSAVLTAAPSSVDALPFGRKPRPSEPEASAPSDPRDSEPPRPPRAWSTGPPAGSFDGASVPSPQSSTGEVLLAEAQQGALPFRGSSPPPSPLHHSEPPPPVEPAMASSPPLPDMDEYVVLQVEIEAAPDLGAALQERKLSAEDWARWKRCWTERCKQDAALASELRAKLSSARRAHRKDTAG